MNQPQPNRVVAYAYRPVVHVVLIVLAIVCFVIFAWAGFGHPNKDSLGWLGVGLALFAGSFLQMADGWVDIVFDGPPSHESGRFVEVEDSTGHSIRLGEWVHRSDGFWALRIPDPHG